jgi:putative Mg2+ transporter-C (MgtC) family protein
VEGVITGIGFIGGGAILKAGASVHGTATAASLWATGAVGAAVALGGETEPALIAVAAILITNNVAEMAIAMAAAVVVRPRFFF